MIIVSQLLIALWVSSLTSVQFMSGHCSSACCVFKSGQMSEGQLDITVASSVTPAVLEAHCVSIGIHYSYIVIPSLYFYITTPYVVYFVDKLSCL